MYYLIALLEMVLPPDKAEQILICIAILLQGFGYLALIRSLGHHRHVVAFLILPLLMSFPLGAGFVNFCLSLGIAYFALSVYFQIRQNPYIRLYVIFGFLTILIFLTHPIPLLILAIYISGDILLCHFTNREGPFWRTYKSQLILLLIAMIAIGLASLWAKGEPFDYLAQFHPLYLLRGLYHLRFLLIVRGSFLLAHLYRAVIYFLWIIAVLINGHKLINHALAQSLDLGDRLFAISILFTVMIPLLPVSIGGGHFFAERMIDASWPLTLAPLAVGRPLPWKARTQMALLSAIMALSIYVWDCEFRPVAQAVAVFKNLPIPSETSGIFVAAQEDHQFTTSALTYPVVFYLGVHALLTRNIVLLNTPWLDQPIIPLERRRGSSILPPKIDSHDIRNYWDLLNAVREDPRIRNIVLTRSQFILYQAIGHQTTSPLSELMTFFGSNSLRDWKCQDSALYALCLKRPAP